MEIDFDYYKEAPIIRRFKGTEEEFNNLQSNYFVIRKNILKNENYKDGRISILSFCFMILCIILLVVLLGYGLMI